MGFNNVDLLLESIMVFELVDFGAGGILVSDKPVIICSEMLDVVVGLRWFGVKVMEEATDGLSSSVGTGLTSVMAVPALDCC